jgi:hypothetical protein
MYMFNIFVNTFSQEGSSFCSNVNYAQSLVTVALPTQNQEIPIHIRKKAFDLRHLYGAKS